MQGKWTSVSEAWVPFGNASANRGFQALATEFHNVCDGIPKEAAQHHELATESPEG